MYKEALIKKIDELPPDVVKALFDIVNSIDTKKRVSEITLLSEAALAEDWLSPEDEEAWKDL